MLESDALSVGEIDMVEVEGMEVRLADGVKAARRQFSL